MAAAVPPSRWGLDPLFWSFARLLCADMNRLETAPGMSDGHVLDGRQLSQAELVGRVVSRRANDKVINFCVDDGTGAARCMLWAESSKAPPPSHVELRLGDLVRVRGELKLETFADGRAMRKVVASSIQTLSDPNAEALHWLEACAPRR
jgi:hypothetical protein